ncbi:MAG: phage tail tip lysozyme, partial [Pseudomonadota bacterium]
HTSAFRAFAPPAMQKLMEALEIDKLDAAAMLGNFGRETGGLKYMEELTPANPPGGINLAQWTGVRRKAFEDWCEASGRDPRSWDAGLDYAIFEMTETWEKRVIPAMRAEKTLWSKTKVFEDLYERAGVPALSDRVRWAMTALEAYDAAPEGSLALPKPAAPKSTGKATGGAIATGGGSMALIDGLMSGSWPLIIGGGVIGLIGIGVFLASSRSKEA